MRDPLYTLTFEKPFINGSVLTSVSVCFWLLMVRMETDCNLKKKWANVFKLSCFVVEKWPNLIMLLFPLMKQFDTAVYRVMSREICKKIAYYGNREV